MKEFSTRYMIQIAILVKDIETVTRNWAEILDQPVPEIVWNNPYEITQAVYKGQPCKARLKQAFFNFDNAQLEIISPADDLPSYWQECLETRGEGVHHISFQVLDRQAMRQRMEHLRAPSLQAGEFKRGRYDYFDTFDKLKVAIEGLNFDDGLPKYGILNP